MCELESTWKTCFVDQPDISMIEINSQVNHSDQIEIEEDNKRIKENVAKINVLKDLFCNLKVKLRGMAETEKEL